ncbi:chitosanase [Abditibacteriota bacterium]|nr:chitosanase [Abditibacteriota bacterium]
MTPPIHQKLTSLFKTNDPNCPLTSVENLNDGRGYTCGWAGFTTADEEVVELVEEYTRRVGGNYLYGMYIYLRFLRMKGLGDTHGLDRRDFKTHYLNACSNPQFHEAYATIVDRKFGEPARDWCEKLGLRLPIAHAILFDSLVQHGNEDDPDGVPAMIEDVGTYLSSPKHVESVFGPSQTNEHEIDWLNSFLAIREKVLTHPYNDDTTEAWGESLSRVEALRHLLETNPQLNEPVVVDCADWKGVRL